MQWLLQRRLDGTNEVIEVTDEVFTTPGVSKVNVLLAEYGIGSREGALELAQALKISLGDIVKLSRNGGFIDGDSRNNLIEYFKSGRISPKLLQFLQRQRGNCGELNNEE